MSDRKPQSDFVRMLALLILYAYEKGYELTGGDLWAKTGHQHNSMHYRRLAIDLNLFRDGVWLKDTADHEVLGKFWESLHPRNRWGGRFEDGNHYEHLTEDWR